MNLRHFLVYSMVSAPGFAAVDFDREQILLRIQPLGSVRLEKQATSHAAVTPPPVEAKKEPGQSTYEQYCLACHRDGVAGAPKFRDAADWKPRLASKNIDQLVASVQKGLNVMPPNGTCAECSAADIKAAIKYMAPRS